MKTILILIISSISFPALSQPGTSAIFQRIGNEMKDFSIDTSAVPDDKLSAEIRKLRTLKGGFNITEAIEYKIAEDLSKGDITKETADEITAFYTTGNGKRWLENAIIHIYRKYFTWEEVKTLVKFYQSAAGKKMAENFPVIMIQSMKAAEQITGQFKKGEIKYAFIIAVNAKHYY